MAGSESAQLAAAVAELEAELAKKKARAARFQLTVKTTAEEVCSAMAAPACIHAALDTTGLRDI